MEIAPGPSGAKVMFVLYNRLYDSNPNTYEKSKQDLIKMITEFKDFYKVKY
jgi:hypothetical protein